MFKVEYTRAVDMCHQADQNPYLSRMVADREDWTNSTLGERLNWVLVNRKDRVGGPTEWAIRAGLKSRGHLVTVLRRWREGKSPEMGSQAVAKLVSVADVPYEWLASGVGHPDKERPESPEDYQMRGKAIARLQREALVSQRAIVAAQSLNSEAFRFWKIRQWEALLLKLTTADALGNESAFRACIERARREGEAA